MVRACVERFYFDHNATTPVAPEVIETMTPYLRGQFGNASSIHQEGQAAKQALERARRQVADFLGCSPKEVVFTSGGTEADNLAVFSSPGHIVTSAIEHPAILAAAKAHGNVTFVAPGRDGAVSADSIEAAIRPDTTLVSVMHVNNELGTVNDIEAIGAASRSHGAMFHSDGVQAAGKLSIPLRHVDLYSISGHKLNAPKGIGALYVRQGVPVMPRQFGGRHEHGVRAGTESVPLAVALGAACALDRENSGALRDELEAGILAQVPNVTVNGRGPRVPNTTNIRFENVEGEAMLIALDLRGFAVSSGAACSSGAVEPSHVLTGIGLSKEQAKASIRFSLGAGNTREQVQRLVEAVAASAAHLRRIAPRVAHV
ncbi:MAG: cysteine desulfurase [Acidobacteria bacterium]|nr:cysteine desulfurase [Acidobacteriota bacterium]